MEAINFEKKQLLQQWKVALIGMQRRDEALQATEEALVKQREQEMALDAECAAGMSRSHALSSQAQPYARTPRA